MLRKTRLPNTNTVGIYLPCLPEDQVPGKPYCVYEPKKEFKGKAAPRYLKERRSWIKKNQPKGFPKHYDSAEEAKKAIKMMKAYGGGWRPPRTTGQDRGIPRLLWSPKEPNRPSSIDDFDKTKLHRAILAAEISLPIWLEENPEDFELLTILDVLKRFCLPIEMAEVQYTQVRQVSILGAEIIEELQDVDSPAAYAAMAVALAARFDVEGAINFATQAFIMAVMPDMAPSLGSEIFSRYLEIQVNSTLTRIDKIKPQGGI